MTLPPPPAQPECTAPGGHNPPAGARLHYALAVDAWARGDLARARTEVAVARLLDPGSAWLRMAEGRIAADQGDRPGARQALEEALSMDPDLGEAREALEELGVQASDERGGR
ncbi:MAG: hypothetical protein JXB39_02155 [Deltaproteobacteria bacterium]|nr:hypothetical protein [Deltaproteobacteria bacterium]